MTTLLPALGNCLRRMTSGEKCLAERLEQKLEDDDLLWYDVPIGSKQTHSDFVILHPRRGLLTAKDKDDDGVPLLKPMSGKDEGEVPLMAILWRHWSEMDLCAEALNRRGLPHQVRKKAGQFDPGQDRIKVMTLHVRRSGVPRADQGGRGPHACRG